MKTIACAVLMAAGAAFAAGPVSKPVAGAKIDSGLGDLLPHYSRWVDKTGKDPLGERRVAQAR
jgi:hypothetical protein